MISNKSKPVADVNILLFRLPDSFLIKGVLTDSIGAFEFNDLSSGNYFIKTYRDGFRDSIIEIPGSSFSTPLHVELVLNMGASLKEVAVTYRKPLIERRSDKLIFNVENSIANIGGEALDALSKTPGIRVNGDNISIVGKSSIRIMINDRLLEISGPDLVNYLKSISSDNISAIEVVTNPSAKYDAQGNSGLINIRLKKNNKEGWSVGLRSSYIQATYPSAATGVNVNYKKKKISIQTNLNTYDGALAPVSREYIFYPGQSWYQTDNRKDYSKYISGQAALDYQLSDNVTTGISYSGSHGIPNIGEQINTPIYNTNNSIDSSLRTSAFTNRCTQYQSLDAYYQYKLGTLGKKISMDANYSVFSDDRIKTYSTQTFKQDGSPAPASYQQYKSDGSQDGNIFTVKGDAELPYKNISLSLGGKLTLIDNVSGFNFYNVSNGNYIIDGALSNKFIYHENVQAVYASIDKTIKKWEIQAGLRGEMTEITANSSTTSFTNADQYFKLFPTALINYKVNDDNSFSLNYGKRIDRPSYWDLNPFRWYFSPYAYAEGNPYLQPSYNNNFEFDYNYKDFFTASVYSSLGNNLQDPILVVTDNTDTQKSIVRNFLSTHSAGASITYIFNKLKWLENNDQLQVYYTKSVSNISVTQHAVDGTSAYLSSSNSIVMNKNKTISGEVNFWYQFAGVDGVDKSNSFYNVDAGAKVKTVHKKMEVSVLVTDIFKSNSASYNTAVNNINQVSNNYFDNRRFTITLKYKFGNDKLKTAQHQAGNQDEAGRIK